MATPPLSLTSSPGQRHAELATLDPVSSLIKQRPNQSSLVAAQSVLLADQAADLLLNGVKIDASTSGVRIWSGPSADRPEHGSSMMPSISESPLEQDFTVEGRPSKLGCPFASMANKKLSSHAASILSRYNPIGSAPRSHSGDDGGAGVRNSVSRVNGKESIARTASRDRRASFADPIKAEICGLDSHNTDHTGDEVDQKPPSEFDELKTQGSQQQDVGVCPIRFLDQHSPEEVATYFERHKHELPRSHEVCVKRYQSNEKQIRELDAKYGNLVSMIQGLGEKHQNYLPKEPDAEEGEGKVEVTEDDPERDEKVRQWASSVSAQAGRGEGDEEDERTPHFERPLRDVRVGESPSRPWGISVPAKYVEEAAVRSQGSSSPVKLKNTPVVAEKISRAEDKGATCPFGFDKVDPQASRRNNDPTEEKLEQPIFVNPDPGAQNTTNHRKEVYNQSEEQSKTMVFTGPVFIGYSFDDARKILKGGVLGRAS